MDVGIGSVNDGNAGMDPLGRPDPLGRGGNVNCRLPNGGADMLPPGRGGKDMLPLGAGGARPPGPAPMLKPVGAASVSVGMEMERLGQAKGPLLPIPFPALSPSAAGSWRLTTGGRGAAVPVGADAGGGGDAPVP